MRKRRQGRVRRTVEDKHVLFATAEECADAAAPVFLASRWRWTRCGIPDREQILNTLLYLGREAQSSENGYCESGRLVAYNGKFGHERPMTANK